MFGLNLLRPRHAENRLWDYAAGARPIIIFASVIEVSVPWPHIGMVIGAQLMSCSAMASAISVGHSPALTQLEPGKGVPAIRCRTVSNMNARWPACDDARLRIHPRALFVPECVEG